MSIHSLLSAILLFHALPVRAEGLGEAASLSRNPSLAAAVDQARHAVRTVEDEPEHRWAQNPGHGLNARFTPEGLVMTVKVPNGDGTSRQLSTRWSTAAIGYGEKLTPVPSGIVRDGSATGEGSRVEIVRTGLVEWFVNGKLGLEHGWTLSERPAGGEGGEGGSPLRVEMILDGDLSAEVSTDRGTVILRDVNGKEALRYSKLKVWDAEGNTLASRMVGGGRKLVVEVEDDVAVYPLTIDPVFSNLQAYLTIVDPEETGDEWDIRWVSKYHSSSAISGDTVVVGDAELGHYEDDLGWPGGAFVFVRDDSGAWTQQAYLKANNAEAGDSFGSHALFSFGVNSVAIDGDTIVIGAVGESSASIANPGDNSAEKAGAAYVFTRDGLGNWTQQAYLKADDAQAFDLFGSSVAIDGDTIVVARDFDGFHTARSEGAVYVFMRDGLGNWTQKSRLRASNGEPIDQFGQSVAVSGGVIVVGAPNEESVIVNDPDDNSGWNVGAVYVFEPNHLGDWVQSSYLKPSNLAHYEFGVNSNFGSSVSVDGDTLVVGAPLERSEDTAPLTGAAFVFVRDGLGGWSQQAYLKASNAEEFDDFGRSVAIDGDVIIVGAPEEDSAAFGANGNQSDNNAESSGAAYIFVRNGVSWTQHTYLKGNYDTFYADTYEEFGSEVGISGDTIISLGYLYADNPASPPPPAFTTLQKPKPFPSTRIGKRSRPLILRCTNTGGSPLTGLRVSASGKAKGDFLLVQPALKTLAPGGSTTFTATFRPKSKGSRKATLEVRSNAPIATAPLSGKGKAK